MEEVPVHKLYRVSITLEVPQKALAAKEDSHDANAAIRAALLTPVAPRPAQIQRELREWIVTIHVC